MRHLFLLSLFLASTGFTATSSATGCAEYYETMSDPAKRIELLQWADREIFSRTFQDRDFTLLEIVGPNRNGGNLSPKRAGINVLPWIEGLNIRAVGPDKFHPNLLLLGHRAYQGFVIARGPMEESLRDTTVQLSSLKERNGRIGIMCYDENDSF